MSDQISICWLRRDLRLEDNAALYHALKSGNQVLLLFIFDTTILAQLEDKDDARVSFIHQQLTSLNQQLLNHGSSLLVKHGNPLTVWTELVQQYSIKSVYINHDYEPYAIQRDEVIKNLLNNSGIGLFTFKDHVIFEKGEILKEDETPYTVFTPYKNKWLSKLNGFYLKSYPTEKYHNYYKTTLFKTPSLAEVGFKPSSISFPDKEFENILATYAQERNFPSLKGTSRISVHLRFGTVSIRQVARKAYEVNSLAWLNELIWRDFYFMILWHFPYVADKAFKPVYDHIIWRNNEEEFRRWCDGNTGYPIVDAGMRELNATGFMHNRVRMIVASFLTKHLLIDWRWGEAYFAKKLLDFELASNNGGWQWAAGSGCDAAPYFRIFNPTEQTKKFDPEFNYIRKWVPEFQELNYPSPVVDHKLARERCLNVYKLALNNKTK